VIVSRFQTAKQKVLKTRSHIKIASACGDWFQPRDCDQGDHE